MTTARATLPPPIPLDAVRFGLLSDSHAHADTTRQGVAALLDMGAQTLLHLGDIGSDAVLEELLASRDGAEVPVRVVFGNTDDERALARHAARLGIPVDHPVGVYDAGGRLVVAHHGHFSGMERAAVQAGAAYYLHGHTHEARDERVGGVRMINPGALHRARRYSVALLDVERDTLETRFVR